MTLTEQYYTLSSLRAEVGGVKVRVCGLMNILGIPGPGVNSDPATPEAPGLIGGIAAELGYLDEQLSRLNGLLDNFEAALGAGQPQEVYGTGGKEIPAAPQEGTLQRRKASKR